MPDKSKVDEALAFVLYFVITARSSVAERRAMDPEDACAISAAPDSGGFLWK